MTGVQRGRRPARLDARRFVGQLMAPRRASALRALVDGVVVARTLRRNGARSLVAGLGARGRADVVRSIEIAEAVDAGLGLLPLEPTCLRRSVTLMRELDRCGLAATMHVGARREGDHIEAHAWVQVGPVVINDEPDVVERYAELAGGAGAFAAWRR